MSEIYSEERRAPRVFEGAPDEVRGDLLAAYPHLLARLGPHASPHALVAHLDGQQHYVAWIDEPADVALAKAQAPDFGPDVRRAVGYDPERDASVRAAEFMAGRAHDPALYRRALGAGGDPDLAAMRSVGLEGGPQDRMGFASVRGLLHDRRDLESAVPGDPVTVASVVAPDRSGEAFAALVRSAQPLHPVVLGGKHSNGAMVAYDQRSGERLLLKPGSGNPSPARGVSECSASQSAREAAFWAAGVALGLQDYLSETHLLVLDGRSYAAMRFLGMSWQTINLLRRESPAEPARHLTALLRDGTLHRLAAMDWILGNVDSHGGNAMVRGVDLKLIDHGSAFAGASFSPASDPDAFAPAYLTAFSPPGSDDLEPAQRLAALPRVSSGVSDSVKGWIARIDSQVLAARLRAFGVDPQPELDRLAEMDRRCAAMAADLAVNAAWVLP